MIAPTLRALVHDLTVMANEQRQYSNKRVIRQVAVEVKALLSVARTAKAWSNSPACDSRNETRLLRALARLDKVSR